MQLHFLELILFSHSWKKMLLFPFSRRDMGTCSHFSYKASHNQKISKHELMIMAGSPIKFSYTVIWGIWIMAKMECFVCALQERGIALKQVLAQHHNEKPGYWWGLALIGFWNLLHSAGCSPATGWHWQREASFCNNYWSIASDYNGTVSKTIWKKCCLEHMKQWCSTREWTSCWAYRSNERFEEFELLLWAAGKWHFKLRLHSILSLPSEAAKTSPSGSTHAILLGEWRRLDRVEEEGRPASLAIRINPGIRKKWQKIPYCV